MTKVSSKHLREIALASELNEKAIERLLGALYVESKSRKLNLGLRVEELAPFDFRTVELMTDVVIGYKSACPVVVSWIGRGDFNPEKPRKEVTADKLLHACRTAGRLRAKILREIGK